MTTQQMTMNTTNDKLFDDDTTNDKLFDDDDNK